MLTLYFVLYCKVKLAEEVKPSELTSSVERPEYPPPMSNIGPPSPSTSQHRWSNLTSTSLTEVVEKVPVEFIIRQDCIESGFPPQSRWPQWEWYHQPLPGRSESWQLLWLTGLYTSTFRPTESLGDPPLIMTPGTKCIDQITIVYLISFIWFRFTFSRWRQNRQKLIGFYFIFHK